VFEMRRAKLSFGDRLIAEEIGDLREDWMTQADQVLADEQIVAAVYEALAKRCPKSRSRGRFGTPAEVVLRMLKHVRNWSCGVLERGVRGDLVYRDFTRVGAGKVPDAERVGRWGVVLGVDVVKQIHDRIGADRARQGGDERPSDACGYHGRGNHIHHPTDSTLLGDGVRVLIRSMKKITKIVG
jgi:IS5 family transposase